VNSRMRWKTNCLSPKPRSVVLAMAIYGTEPKLSSCYPVAIQQGRRVRKQKDLHCWDPLPSDDYNRLRLSVYYSDL
jgi:hypothetical protein